MPAEGYKSESLPAAPYDTTSEQYTRQDSDVAYVEESFPEAPICPTQVNELDMSMPPPPPPEVQSLPSQSSERYARAIYDYEATSNEEISFQSGELIRIIDNSSDDGWWTGENRDGKVGHFPSMLVSDLDAEEEDEDEDEEESEEEDDEDTVPISISLPPIAPPSLVTVESVEEESTPRPPLPPMFAPPPKPMNLMAPQAVVIIQPTPEIESRPVIGSENMQPDDTKTEDADDIENIDNQETIEVETEDNNGTGVVHNDNGMESGVRVAMAIAAHEVSESITQQAIDDSLLELSRRTSAASSYDECSLDGPSTAAVNVEEATITMNGDMDEEDIK